MVSKERRKGSGREKLGMGREGEKWRRAKTQRKEVEDIGNWTWKGRKGFEGEGRKREGKGK